MKRRRSGQPFQTPRGGATTAFALFNLTATLLLSLVIAGQAVAQSSNIDRVLAIVDEDVITFNDYAVRHRQEQFENPGLAEFSGQVDREILANMVDEQLQIAQAERRNLSVSSQEIDGAVSFVARQNNLTVAQLIEQLESEDFTYAQFRDSLREQQLIRKLVDSVANSRVVVSDQEIQNYINARDELQNFEETYEVSHLFVLTQNRSETEIAAERQNLQFIREGLIGGQDFAQAVRNYSDAANTDEGGYLGFRSADQLPELFVEALREMQPGGSPEQHISQILQSENGLHLLKLHSKRGSGNVVQQQNIQHILIQPG